MAEKIKFEREYLINASPTILFNRLHTPSGLSEWFANDVNIKDDVYTFRWAESEEEAKVIERQAETRLRLQWLEDEGTDYYFEFRIKIDGLTNELALVITDFAEPDEKDEAERLWDSQINVLTHNLGG